MSLDFQTMYFVISIFYSTITLTFLILKEDANFPPFLIGLISMIVSVFIGWLLFPILLLYNIFVKKSLI